MHTSCKEPKSLSGIGGDRKRDSTRSASINPNDLAFPVPPHILPDVEYIPYASLYLNVHAQRDRRLRRLVRRYVNQIQYGCLNVNCNVPTCLSYRKRTSKVPLRRYTDLSARTIACQLIEELGKQGKDVTTNLCPNPPLIPWYEDPSDFKRRQRPGKSSGKIEISDPYPDRDYHAAKAQFADHLRKTALGREDVQTIDGGTTSAKTCAEQTIDQDGDFIAALHSENHRTLTQSSTDSATSNETQPIQPKAAEKKDPNSITQCLFDLLPMRLLASWRIPERRIIPELVEKTAEFSSSSSNFGSEGTCDPKSHAGTSTAAPDDKEKVVPDYFVERVRYPYTLSRLSWSSLKWLSVVNNLTTRPFGHCLDRFAQQSIWYCLSNPERLIDSANDWGQYETSQNSYSILPSSNAGSLHKDLPPSPSHTVTISEGSQLVSNNITKHKYGLARKMRAFTRISQIRPYDEMLDALFSAMQHTFAMPPWFEDSVGKSLQGHDDPHIIRQKSSPADQSSALLPAGRDRSSKYSAHDQTNTEFDFQIPEKMPYLRDSQVSQLCLLALLAPVSLAFENYKTSSGPGELGLLAKLRNNGYTYPILLPASYFDPPDSLSRIKANRSIVSTIDKLEDWHVIRLVSTVMKCVSHRLALAEARKARKLSKTNHQPVKNIVDMIIEGMGTSEDGDPRNPALLTAQLAAMLIELLRSIMLKSWDRDPVIQVASAVGGTLQLLAGFYLRRRDLGLDPSEFHMPFVAEAFGDLEMPTEWLNFRPDNVRAHILSFSFLFESATLVKYFRAVNIDIMRKSHENAAMVDKHVRDSLLGDSIPIYGKKDVLAQLRPHMAKYFVLTIQRTNVLSDAINQIWRRQRRELMRPLRVRLGKDEGEDGLDHGGVQQEFFRIVFAEALQPDYGMFSIDGTTRMTWFNPGSLEPLYKFEALGVLMSLAVYNAVTLPITFPLAFYRKLLGLKVKKIEHIADGWQALTNGLVALLDWTDGDVGDVIARTYAFSYEAFGTVVTVDMQKVRREDTWPPIERPNKKGKEKAKTTSFELPLGPQYTPPNQPSPPLLPTSAPNLSRSSSIEIRGLSTPVSIESESSDDAALVTDSNREQYVKDYIFWLTDKSIRPQYEAFAKGFYTCLNRTALSLFTPEALRDVMEGHRNIDIDELERTATYDEYEKQSPTITTFWDVVKSFSPDQHRQLLEFVTASDRIPVNGIGSIQFMIQRNGDDDSRLPSSSTCYGRLLLPQYSNRAIMEEKLAKAIENSIGFGAL